MKLSLDLHFFASYSRGIKRNKASDEIDDDDSILSRSIKHEFGNITGKTLLE